MKLFYKILIISASTIFSAFLLVTILFTLYLTYKIPFNNYNLKVFEGNFRKSIAALHPKQSSLIAEVAEVGNWADGTQCQFFVGQFRSSSFSKEELKQAYFEDSMSSGVDFVDEDIFSHSPWLGWKENYLKNYKPKENETVYLVWASDDDNLPDGDIRCH
jgi:hypothetical protein